jgi:hypothetical protein
VCMIGGYEWRACEVGMRGEYERVHARVHERWHERRA